MLRPRPEVWLPPEPVEGGVVREGGVDIAGADAGHRMGQRRARQRIRVGANVGFRQQIADGVVMNGADGSYLCQTMPCPPAQTGRHRAHG